MNFIFIGIILVNTLASFVTVFRDRRDVSSTWAWLLLLTLLPVVGFVLYLFIGKKLSRDNIFDMKNQKRLGLKVPAEKQKALLKANQLLVHDDIVERELVSMFLTIDEATYTTNNKVELITTGQEKFERLLEDIKKAQHHVHVQYYIFENDDLGKKVMEALYEKAKEGVEVLVLYDAWGSHTIRPAFFNKLTKMGGKAMPFFGSSIPFVNLRMNYRNHRKMVIIDGKIGYTGGYNIGDEYLGKGKLGYWRDTHMRLQGEVVHSLQSRFFMDWNAAVSKDHERAYKKEYFPHVDHPLGQVPMQLVSSGPESDVDQIKMGYLKMITAAKKSIYIQTPYFILDASILDALQIAISSGVSVNIMIPCKPDHIGVYRASEYYAKWLSLKGANIYIYKRGFIHSKVVVIDDKIASVGTANFDIRSFSLNFEVNAFIYDRQVAKQLVAYFQNDVTYSVLGDAHYFQSQSSWTKIKQAFFRMFSPIL